MVQMQVTPRSLALICEAMDSHIYWQLSDEHYRHDGYVQEPGSDDAANAKQIAAAVALLRRLESTLQSATPAEAD